MQDKLIRNAITFDDVLLEPRFSEIVPADCSVATRLTKRIPLNIPLLSSPMDTVTEHEMAIALAREGGVEFLVRDGGAGIAADDLPRVFDKAYRGRNAAGIPGSGLGLYVARAIVDVHGGTISARNLSESGVEFRIWLPAAAGAGKGLAPADASSDNSSDAS